ncbi:cysteine desulfurase NifS [archaeon]|nr:cysteine desulfurase NifS [archaeon]|tara:strand:+ start:250 stop:1368 length:1119 start_codon:yes stop_codon:yes gene_type:complete
MEIYLDNAATTKVDDTVLKSMLPFLKDKYGNASSIYRIGEENREKIEESRNKIAKFLGVNNNEIIFTSSGSEANNFALKGVMLREKNKHVITTKIEHSSVLNTCKYLEKFHKVTYLDVNEEGFVDLSQLKKAISKDTILVSVQSSNNEIGVIQDIKEIGKICKKNKVLLHVDAVQSFGKTPLDLKNIDLLTISAHKIYGPKGIGVLYVKDGVKIDPLIHGGEQEFGLRGGTENVANIVGFGEAVELINFKEQDKIIKLRELLIKRVLNEIPDSFLNGSLDKRLSNNASFGFKDVYGEDVVKHLNYNNVFCSTGSACTQGTVEVSHVLKSLGLNDKDARSCIRMTLGKYNTEKEVKFVVENLKIVIDSLRKVL